MRWSNNLDDQQTKIEGSRHSPGNATLSSSFRMSTTALKIFMSKTLPMTEVNLFNMYYQFLSPLNTGYVQAIKIILKEDVVIIFTPNFSSISAKAVKTFMDKILAMKPAIIIISLAFNSTYLLAHC